MKKTTEQIIEKVKAPKRKEQIEFLTTGVTLFNLVAGGGFPCGKIVNIVGDKSSGKTLLAVEAIAANRKNIKWFYDDAEAGFSFDTKKIYGFDIQIAEDSSNTIEQFGKNFNEQLDLLKKDEKLIYVLDCLDSLTSEAEIKRNQKEKEKGTYNLEKQKQLGEFFRLLKQKIKEKNCVLIIISQVRINIGVMFGEKYYRTGGKALDFYAAQIIWLAECEKHKRKGRVVGVTIKIKIRKNKVGLPFRECFLDILFDYGVDNISSNLYFLYDLRTDTGKIKKKEKIVWGDKEYTIKQLIKYVEENNLEKELEARVVNKWKEIEDSISSKERKSKYINILT